MYGMRGRKHVKARNGAEQAVCVLPSDTGYVLLSTAMLIRGVNKFFGTPERGEGVCVEG